MDAVLRVDLEAKVVLAPSVNGNKFVNPRRAEPLLGTPVHLQVVLHRDGIVLEGEVRGLVMLVVCVCEGHGRQEVETDFPVRLWVLDGLAVLSRLKLGMVWAEVVQGPGLLALEEPGKDTRV